ncbi:MAG: hypothetical protein IJJ14_00385, partial [Coriobacteriales bacterium]|nr:hypothetical protein [Coriobacteriales bacterium]
FSVEELRLLESAKGQVLQRSDAVVVARDDLSWKTVRLHFADLHFDVNNQLGTIEVDEFGSLEEFGLLSVQAASDSKLIIPGVAADTTVMQIDRTIVSIEVVSDYVDIYGDGQPVASITYPQAIVFHTEEGDIVLDKEVWFSEMIAVKIGESARELLYDESVNWVDELDESPSTHYEFKTVIETL